MKIILSRERLNFEYEYISDASCAKSFVERKLEMGQQWRYGKMKWLVFFLDVWLSNLKVEKLKLKNFFINAISFSPNSNSNTGDLGKGRGEYVNCGNFCEYKKYMFFLDF